MSKTLKVNEIRKRKFLVTFLTKGIISLEDTVPHKGAPFFETEALCYRREEFQGDLTMETVFDGLEIYSGNLFRMSPYGDKISVGRLSRDAENWHEFRGRIEMHYPYWMRDNETEKNVNVAFFNNHFLTKRAASRAMSLIGGDTRRLLRNIFRCW